MLWTFLLDMLWKYECCYGIYAYEYKQVVKFCHFIVFIYKTSKVFFI